MKPLQFIELLDYLNEAYFSVNLTDTPTINVTHLREVENVPNIASHLFPFMNITPRATGLFSNDLTQRDDALLAFLSLLILLIIEAIITTILLRRSHGLVTNFGFAVKQIIEFIKDLNVRRVFFVRNLRHSFSSSTKQALQQRQEQPPLSRLNVRLLILAFSILFLSFGLEVAVFFLTNSHNRSVTNATATFRLLQPTVPNFVKVLLHTRASIHRPCEAITILNVLQASTRINGCVDTDIDFSDITLFAPGDQLENVTLRIESRLHDFGSNHFIQVGGANATYKQRTLFSLSDGRSRIMPSNGTSPDEEEQMQVVHYQYVAYLFSAFNRGVANRNESIPLQRLQDLNIEWQQPTSGDRVDVKDIPGLAQQVRARRYVTQVQGEIPRGTAALRLAQHYFQDMMAVVVAEGNVTDMFMDGGVEDVEAEVWEEDVRSMNWLTMGVLAAVGVGALTVLRYILRPSSTAEIARISMSRELKGENGIARVDVEDEVGRYIFGAEIDGAEETDGTLDYLRA